ncbi:hypothetical protein HDU86_005227 [Geranomyces michiganensis]|nr:hypothetical protein HDU86_005227 [Geranomyces michiganensis]
MESRTKRQREESSGDEPLGLDRNISPSAPFQSLCRTLDSLLPSLATPGPQITTACEVLNHLHELLRQAAGCRVSENSAEAATQRADLRLVVATVDPLIRLPSVRLQVGALRVVSIIVKPSGIKLRNWAFARFDVGRSLQTMHKRLVVLVCSPEPQAQFYSLKILTTVCKTVAGSVSPLVSVSTLNCLAEILEEPSSSPNLLLLAVTFLRRLWETAGVLSRVPAHDRLIAALEGTVTFSVPLRNTHSHVSVTENTADEYLAQAIPLLYLLVKQKASHQVNPATAAALIETLNSSTLDIARFTCAILLNFLKQKEASQLGSLYPLMIQGISEYAHMLSENRPSVYLVVTLLETLALCLPRSLETACAARRANISLALLKLWRTMKSDAYAAKYPSSDVSHAQAFLLKILTFLLGDPTGLEVYMQASCDLLSQFHGNLMELIQQLLGGQTVARHRVGPGLGLRSLRLISVLVSNARCRRILVRDKLLSALIDPEYADKFMSGTVEAAQSTFTLLFRVLRLLALDSGIRFNMRDGRLWSSPDEDLRESSDVSLSQIVTRAQRSDFTVVHFCLQIFVYAMLGRCLADNICYKDDLIQISLIFLWENYRNDTTVANIICRCPLALLVLRADRVPPQWLEQSQETISICPALVELITARSVDPGLDLDFGAAEPVPVPESVRLAAANILDMLMSVRNGQLQLLTPSTLSTLVKSMCFDSDDLPQIGRIIPGVLIRLMGNPELLQATIENLGFSSIFEPILSKEDCYEGDSHHFLEALSDALHKQNPHPGTMVARLRAFFSTSPNKEAAASAIKREKLAVAMAYCSPSELISGVLEVPPDPLRKACVDELLTLATSETPRKKHSIMALKYVCWANRTIIQRWTSGHEIPPSRTFLESYLRSLEASPLRALHPQDIVRFSFPEEPDVNALICARTPLVDGSPVLKAMLSWDDRTGRHAQHETEIRDIDRATWALFTAYLEAASEHQIHDGVFLPAPRLWSIADIQKIARLAECADRFLCEELFVDCLRCLHFIAVESLRFRRCDGAGIFLRDFSKIWENRIVGHAALDLILRIARLGFLKTILEVAKGNDSATTANTGRDPNQIPEEMYALKDENLDLKRRINEQDEKTKQLVTKVQRLTDDLKRAKDFPARDGTSRPVAAATRAVISRREAAEVDDMVDDLRQQLRNLSKDNSQLRNKMNFFKSLHEAETRKDYSNLKHLKLLVARRVKDAKTEAPAKEDHVYPSEDVAKLEELVNMLRAKLLDAERDLECCKTENQGLRDAVAGQEQQNDIDRLTHQRTIADLQKRLQETYAKGESLNEKNRGLTESYDDAMHTVESLTADLKEERRRRAEIEARLGSGESSLKRIEELNIIIDDLRAEKKLLEDEQSRLLTAQFSTQHEEEWELERTRLQRTIQDLESRLSVSLKEAISLHSQVNDLRDQLAALTSEKRSAEANMYNLQHELEEMKRAIAFLVADSPNGIVDWGMVRDAVTLWKTRKAGDLGVQTMEEGEVLCSAGPIYHGGQLNSSFEGEATASGLEDSIRALHRRLGAHEKVTCPSGADQ